MARVTPLNLTTETQEVAYAPLSLFETGFPLLGGRGRGERGSVNCIFSVANNDQLNNAPAAVCHIAPDMNCDSGLRAQILFASESCNNSPSKTFMVEFTAAEMFGSELVRPPGPGG